MAVDDAVAAYMERLKRKVGHRSQPHVQGVEAGAIAKFARAIGETNPLYFDESYARTTRFGGIIAPPTYASCFITPLLPGEMLELDLPPLNKALHTDDIAENDLPIRPGDVLTTVARYADVFTKQGRQGPILFQAADLTVTNQAGRRVALIRMLAASFLGKPPWHYRAMRISTSACTRPSRASKSTR